MRNKATREGYEFWDKICAVQSYAFLLSPDGRRVVKTPDIGDWIDKHEAQVIVDQAQEEVNGLKVELTALREELARKDKVIQAFHDGYGYQQMQQSLADAERLNAEVRQELSDADEEKMELRRKVIEATAWISDYRRSLDRQSFQDNDEGDRQSRMHSRLCRSLDLFLGLNPTESGASE